MKTLAFLFMITGSYSLCAKERTFWFIPDKLGIKLQSNVKLPSNNAKIIHFKNKKVQMTAQEYSKNLSVFDIVTDIQKYSEKNKIKFELVAPVYYEDNYGLLFKLEYSSPKKVVYQRIFGDTVKVASFVLECFEDEVKNCGDDYLFLLKDVIWKRTQFAYLKTFFSLNHELPSLYKPYKRDKKSIIMTKRAEPLVPTKKSPFVAFAVCSRCKAPAELKVLQKNMGLTLKEVNKTRKPFNDNNFSESLFIDPNSHDVLITCIVKKMKSKKISSCYFRYADEENSILKQFEKVMM